jgi:SAM-dependent methyltransferase
MNYEEVGANIRASYREVCPQYRHDDEIEVATDNHQRLSRILRRISSSFDHPASVLDAGCGTGRYFHCLENVDFLIGLDLSPEILRAAESPVRQEEIEAREVQLVCQNVFATWYPPESFDFIYSLGMFGYGCPLTVEICERFHAWLKPAGVLFFNVVDWGSLRLRERLRKRLRHIIEPILPSRLRKSLAERRRRLPFFGMTASDLRNVMEQSSFNRFVIDRRVCRSPLWRGVLLECTACK